MDADLFNDKTPLVEYRGDAWRVVESQEDAATLAIVDSTEEQYLLEVMLEGAKPPYRKGTENMDYLLKTAFRYPPLEYGSRFGTQLMPSYFYASEQAETAFCETAYYRFLFFEHMKTPYEDPIRSKYSIFKVTLASAHCLDLTASIFSGVQKEISNPESNSYSQGIGKWASESQPQTELIRFYSARKIKEINLAVAGPKVIRSRKPRELRTWLCLSRWNADLPEDSSVSFISRDSKQLYEFRRKDYCDKNGRFLSIA